MLCHCCLDMDTTTDYPTIVLPPPWSLYQLFNNHLEAEMHTACRFLYAVFNHFGAVSTSRSPLNNVNRCIPLSQTSPTDISSMVVHNDTT